MKVLIACEYSGIERDAFLRAGHDAISCDVLPSESPGPHYEGDVRDLMYHEWDLVIAHPPCTYLSNSGVRWLYNSDGSPNIERWSKMGKAAAFFDLMFSFNSPRIAVENPVQHRYAKIAHGWGDPSQTIQPYQFGHMETKRTCLWLVGLPLLQPTNNVEREMRLLPKRDTHKVHFASPGENRSKVRSLSYSGIADAMADQWGCHAA